MSPARLALLLRHEQQDAAYHGHEDERAHAERHRVRLCPLVNAPAMDAHRDHPRARDDGPSHRDSGDEAEDKCDKPERPVALGRCQRIVNGSDDGLLVGRGR